MFAGVLIAHMAEVLEVIKRIYGIGTEIKE